MSKGKLFVIENVDGLWNKCKEHADDLGFSEESFRNDSKLRKLLDSYSDAYEVFKICNDMMLELVKFKDSKEYENLPNVVKLAINDKMDSLRVDSEVFGDKMVDAKISLLSHTMEQAIDRHKRKR